MGYVINVTLTREAQAKRNLKAEWENGNRLTRLAEEDL